LTTDLFFEIVDRTDTGLVRRANEDAVAVHLPLGLVLIADGMGGAAAGEVASQLAVEGVFQYLVSHSAGAKPSAATDERLLQQAVRAANRSIRRMAREYQDFRGMGTTVVAGLLRPHRLSYAHVGDSRLYRLREGRFECLTRDHSLMQEVLDDGVFSSMTEAREAGISENVLTRALGTDPSVETDVATTPIEQGDMFLFCTDGLYNMLDERLLQAEMEEGRDDLDQLADRLLELACYKGGGDNVTLVLVRRLHWDTRG